MFNLDFHCKAGMLNLDFHCKAGMFNLDFLLDGMLCGVFLIDSEVNSRLTLSHL